MNKTAISKT